MNLEDDFKELQLQRYNDERGWFMNAYELEMHQELLGMDVKFVMDNISHSQKGVLRGLHYQREQPQGKLVTVLKGAIYDVAVDLREGSINYGKWKALEVSLEKGNQVWVPPGFAHGFLALEESIVHYKTTDFYAPDDQYIIAWDDPSLGIKWPDLNCDYVLSARDAAGASLVDLR